MSWFDEDAPEDVPIPDGYHNSLNTFHKLMLIRCWCQDRTLNMAKNYIAESIGTHYVEPVILNLEAESLTMQSPNAAKLSPRGTKAKDPAKESPKDSAKESPKNSAKESSKDPAKELEKDPAKELAKDPAKESVNQSVHQSAKESTKESTKDPVKELAKDPEKESVNQSTTETAKESTKNSVKESPKDPGKKSANKLAKEPVQSVDWGSNATPPRTGKKGKTKGTAMNFVVSQTEAQSWRYKADSLEGNAEEELMLLGEFLTGESLHRTDCFFIFLLVISIILLCLLVLCTGALTGYCLALNTCVRN